MSRKNRAAVELGRRGGKVGGKSKSQAKAEAARQNGARNACRCGDCPVCLRRKNKSSVAIDTQSGIAV